MHILIFCIWSWVFLWLWLAFIWFWLDLIWFWRVLLASFELPDNIKIREIYEKHENGNWSFEAKHGLPECFVEGKIMFWMWTFICRGQTYQTWSKNDKKWPKTFLFSCCFSRKVIKYIPFGKLDQKSLFFIWFFIDNGQKTNEKIRKNWI